MVATPILLAAGAVFLLFVLPLYYCVIYPYFLSPLRHLPGPSSITDNVFMGQFKVIMDGEAGIPQRKWVKEHGDIVRVVGPFGIERLIFTRPEGLQKVLVSDWLEYPRPKFMRDVLGIVTGMGLLTVTGNEHKMMRKTMIPAFSMPNLVAQTQMYYDSIQSMIDILRNKVRDTGGESKRPVLHMYEWMSKVTLDIICTTAFGYNANSLHNPDNELAAAYEDLINLQSGKNLARFIAAVSIPGFTRFLMSEYGYKSRHWFGKFGFLENAAVLVDCMYRIKTISRALLDDKLKESAVPLEDMESKRDIMSILVRSHKAQIEAEEAANAKSGSTASIYKMTDEMMMDQVLTFLGAGHETTASGLAWSLYLLAAHPEAQQKLRDECQPIFRSETGELLRPDHKTMKECQWLDCVVMESLRILPPVPMTIRQAGKTDYINGVLVPKGTFFYIPIRVVNTYTAIWGKDAEEFNPSRWLNLPPSVHPTMSFLSFIAGPHVCIGKTMAILEMKAILGAIISHFEFSLSYDGQLPKPTAAVTMKPEDGMPLRVRAL